MCTTRADDVTHLATVRRCSTNCSYFVSRVIIMTSKVRLNMNSGYCVEHSFSHETATFILSFYKEAISVHTVLNTIRPGVTYLSVHLKVLLKIKEQNPV